MTAELRDGSDLGDRVVDLFPPDWSRSPFWSVYRRVKRASTGDEVLLSVYRDHGVVRKSDRDDNFNKASDDLSLYQRVSKSDLVVNKMKAWQGSVAISTLDGIVSPAYFVFEPTSLTDPRFMHYLLRSDPYVAAYRAASKGIRPNQWDLDPDVLRVLPLCLPPLKQQSEIALFLNRETAEIDAFIRDQEELVRLLNERRAATISHVVTKGLNRSEQLKDNRFPWLGSSPASWTVGPLKHFADILPGFAFSSSEFVEDRKAISLLRGINVGIARIDWTERVAWSGVLDPRLRRYELATGDLVLGLDRTIISSGVRLSTVTAQDLPALLVQRVARIRAFQPNINRYLAYALGGDAFAQYVAPIFSGVSVPHLSTEQVGQFTLAVPPAPVQARIADFLDERVAEIDATISDARESIEVMRERRAALISATVTGKIDVRARLKEA